MICKIVSDSSCDLRMSAFDGGELRFETVPLRLQVGEREFIDNDALEIPQLLGAMAQEKSAASTACPSPAAFAKAFEEADRVVCFTISANLSGTYNAAVLGRDMALEPCTWAGGPSTPAGGLRTFPRRSLPRRWPGAMSGGSGSFSP